MADAYPLDWPVRVPRTKYPRRSPFIRMGKANRGPWQLGAARDDLLAELRRLHVGTGLVISTNIALRNDGLPRAGQAEPADRGVAIYFTRASKPYCFPCDRWDRVADNIHAVTLHLAAMRGQERWGVGTLEQAFTGYLALGPGKARLGEGWREVLGDATSLDEVEFLFKEAAKAAHPDRGGSDEDMRRLLMARAAARAELGAEGRA